MRPVFNIGFDEKHRAFISTPRRSPAVPNDNGTLGLYTLSTYSLESHSEGKEIRILDLVTGKSALFSDDAKNKEITWLQDEQVLWLREREGGVTEMWCGIAVGEKNVGICFPKLRLVFPIERSNHQCISRNHHRWPSSQSENQKVIQQYSRCYCYGKSFARRNILQSRESRKASIDSEGV